MAKCTASLALVATAAAGAAQAQVSGRVTDAVSGAPVRNAVVDVPQWRKSTTTDSAGHFALTAIPDGRWIVRVRRIGYVGQFAGITVRDAASPPLTIPIRQASPEVPVRVVTGAVPALSGFASLPTAPLPATLGELTVSSDSSRIVGIVGTVAGLPVTLRRTPSGSFVGVFAVPLEATRPVPVALSDCYADGARVRRRDTTLAITVPPAPPPQVAAARREALHVAPVFTAPPTDTTTARIAAETMLAHGVGESSFGSAPLWREPFIRPRPGRVTSPFGRGRQFNGKLISQHTGTDFAGAIGDPVMAANRGVVVLVADFFLAGTVIYVDHGGGLISAYFHLSDVRVAMGDTVSRGQVIGAVGHTGRVTGPHLHWVVRYGTTPVDAMTALALTPLPADTLPATCHP